MTFNDSTAATPNIRVRHVQANIVHSNTAGDTGDGKTYGYSNVNQCVNGASSRDGLPIYPDVLSINEGTGNGDALLLFCDNQYRDHGDDYALAAEGIDSNCPAGQWVATQTFVDNPTPDVKANKVPILFNRKYFNFVSYELIQLHPNTQVLDPNDPDYLPPSDPGYPFTIADQYMSFLTVTTTAAVGCPTQKTLVFANIHVDRGWTSGGKPLKMTNDPTKNSVRGQLGVDACNHFRTEVLRRKTGDPAVIWGGDINSDFFTAKSAAQASTPATGSPYYIFNKGDDGVQGHGMDPVFDTIPNGGVPNDDSSITHASVVPTGDAFPADGTSPDWSKGGLTYDWSGSCDGDGKVHAFRFETKTLMHSDHKGVFTTWKIDY